VSHETFLLAGGLHGASKLLLAGRLVENDADAAAADASGELHDPESQNYGGIVGVDGFVAENRFPIVDRSLVRGFSRAQSGKLAHGVEAEDGRGDQGGKVNAAQAAGAAESGHASVQVVRTD